MYGLCLIVYSCLFIIVERCWPDGWYTWLPIQCVYCAYSVLVIAAVIQCQVYPDFEIVIMVGLVQASLYSLYTLVSRYTLIFSNVVVCVNRFPGPCNG